MTETVRVQVVNGEKIAHFKREECFAVNEIYIFFVCNRLPIRFAEYVFTFYVSFAFGGIVGMRNNVDRLFGVRGFFGLRALRDIVIC